MCVGMPIYSTMKCMEVMTKGKIITHPVQNGPGMKCEKSRPGTYIGKSGKWRCKKFATKQMGVQEFCRTYESGNFKGCFKCIVN